MHLSQLQARSKFPPSQYFVKLALLPEGGDQVSFEDWQHLIAQLTEEEQEEMREIITLKIERRKKTGRLEITQSKKGGIKMKSFRKALNYALAIVMSFCCVFLIGAVAINSIGNSASSTPIQVIDTSLPIPTLIALTYSVARTQTAIAAPPTTPASVDTLTPFPTETQIPSVEIKAYALSMSSYSSDYGKSMQELGTLLQTAGYEPALLIDDNWKMSVVLVLAKLQIYGDGLGSISNPPPELQQTDYWLKQISSENNLLISNLTTGIDNLDIGSINRANANIKNIDVYFQNATTELNKVLSADTYSPETLATATIFVFKIQTNAAQVQPTEYIYSTNTPFSLETQPAISTQPQQTEACSCSIDYDCPEFSSHTEAQACFDYCKSKGYGDVHGLDRDDDNLACEETNY